MHEVFVAMVSRRNMRCRGIGIIGSDLKMLSKQNDRMFVKMMQKKFGLRLKLNAAGSFDHQDLLVVSANKSSNQQKPSPRRAHLLSRALENLVFDLMTSASYSERLRQWNVSFSQVRVLDSFSWLEIRWVARGQFTDELVEETLSEIAPLLRQDLQSLYTVGHIPPVRFVRDVSHLQEVAMDGLFEKLSTADGRKSPAVTALHGMLSDTVLYKELKLTPEEPDAEFESAETVELEPDKS